MLKKTKEILKILGKIPGNKQSKNKSLIIVYLEFVNIFIETNNATMAKKCLN
jgi:hypothetical protein